jgi:hypothetical protein
VYFGAREIQSLSDKWHCIARDVPEHILHVVQDGEQRARLAGVPF